MTWVGVQPAPFPASHLSPSPPKHHQEIPCQQESDAFQLTRWSQLVEGSGRRSRGQSRFSWGVPTPRWVGGGTPQGLKKKPGRCSRKERLGAGAGAAGSAGAAGAGQPEERADRQGRGPRPGVSFGGGVQAQDGCQNETKI